MFAYFRISESSPNMPNLIAAVLGVYEQISSHFKAGDYDYECNCHDCPDPGTDLGCISIGEGPVIVCIANQRGGAETLAEAFVHELSHRFAGSDDFSYCKSGPGCAELTPDKAIGNATSYNLFAADAWLHKMGA
ncbi:MAG: hypothetical protein J2P49_03395 [Methylocapsa sp.]|nr:hypothetical protein [Methylocapsa sp.]